MDRQFSVPRQNRHQGCRALLAPWATQMQLAGPCAGPSGPSSEDTSHADPMIKAFQTGAIDPCASPRSPSQEGLSPNSGVVCFPSTLKDVVLTPCSPRLGSLIDSDRQASMLRKSQSERHLEARTVSMKGFRAPTINTEGRANAKTHVQGFQPADSTRRQALKTCPPLRPGGQGRLESASSLLCMSQDAGNLPIRRNWKSAEDQLSAEPTLQRPTRSTTPWALFFMYMLSKGVLKQKFCKDSASCGCNPGSHLPHRVPSQLRPLTTAFTLAVLTASDPTSPLQAFERLASGKRTAANERLLIYMSQCQRSHQAVTQQRLSLL